MAERIGSLARATDATTRPSLALALALGACVSAACAGPPPDGTRDAGTDAAAGDADPDAAATDAGAAPLATTLPLEVLGPAGTEVTAAIAVTDAQLRAARDARLVLTLHNVVEPDAAEVQVNGAAPIDLGAAGGPFLRRHGGAASGSVPIDPAQLVAGSNRLTFRYHRQIDAVTGFRVLAAAIALGDQTVALDLPPDDPATWRPVRTDAASVARGQQYFQQVSRDGGPTCSQCHTDSGADLQYFAFSNTSVIARAMVPHQFSRSEAEDIASYLRALPLAPAGRPFDPPFQPGAAGHGAAGAGLGALLPDAASFAQAAFGAAGLPADVPWDWAQAVDTHALPTAVQLPSWARWLPRHIDPTWFTRQGGALANAQAALAATPSVENARTFMSAAIGVGREIVAESGDHANRIDLLRFAAVKLWDWSRHNGFDAPDHGLPDGGPAYPYELGFGFFEAADAGYPEAYAQTIEWWWTQLALDPGRGLSNGERPLNYRDVELAAQSAGLAPAQIEFLHLYGSWEESRGALADQFGTANGPVRLLALPMAVLAPADRVVVLRRYLAREGEFLLQGGALDDGHHTALARAWSTGCAALSPAQRAELRGVAPTAVQPDLAACPDP